MKRLFDFIIASCVMVLLLPVFILVALLIRIFIGTPVIFKQQRPGLYGKPFYIYKFRTMTNEKDASGNLLSDEQRLTPLGAYIRRLSLDEIPQLINVLKGELSLVGPRPLLMSYLDRYDNEQIRRHEVKPGITGWAQVNGRNAISWEEKFKLDVWYVDNHSFLLDLKIMWMTVRKVAKSEGISQTGHVTMSEFLGKQPDKIVIIGAGGQGRETLQLIRDINRNAKKDLWDVVGFIDDNVDLQGRIVNGVNVLGGLNTIPADSYIICAIGNSQIRQHMIAKIFEMYSQVRFANLIHPSAIIGEYTSLGVGNIICSNCTVTTNISIGNHALINYNSSIGHDTILEDFVTILPGCNISGNVTLKQCSQVGSATSIIPGITVGERSYVGAGAAVIRDIPEQCTAVGVPAVPIKYHNHP